MIKFVIIAIGGAIGSVFRYWASGLDYRWSNGIFPISTFVINASGSLVIGFLWGLFERYSLSPNLRHFLFIGLLGGYTTFSTFSLETFNLLRDGENGIALMNILLSNAAGILFVFIGYYFLRLVSFLR